MNLQPSEAQAGFDIRVPPTADQASLERRIAEEWAPASRNMTFEVKQFYATPLSNTRRKCFSYIFKLWIHRK